MLLRLTAGSGCGITCFSPWSYLLTGMPHAFLSFMANYFLGVVPGILSRNS